MSENSTKGTARREGTDFFRRENLISLAHGTTDTVESIDRAYWLGYDIGLTFNCFERPPSHMSIIEGAAFIRGRDDGYDESVMRSGLRDDILEACRENEERDRRGEIPFY